MPTIRDTINPLNEREVSDEEALDLERQNVVLTGTRAKTPEGLLAAAARQSGGQLGGDLAEETGPSAVIGVGDLVDDEHHSDDDVDESHDPGSAPVSDATPTRNSTQES